MAREFKHDSSVVKSGAMSSKVQGFDQEEAKSTSLSLESDSASLKEWGTLSECLGKGTIGEVYEYNALEKYGVPCAAKKVRIERNTLSDKGLVELKNEINTLREIRHKRLVAYYGSAEKDDFVFIFMELMRGGSLARRIKEKKSLPEIESWKYTKQMLEGASYLHSKKIIHRDIKASNVLLDEDGNVKLADFTLSKIIRKIGSKSTLLSQSTLLSHCGSPYWMAPEIFWGRGYDGKVDIWSVGCTVVEMLTGKPPLDHLEPVAAILYIGSKPMEPKLPKDISEATKKLITAALTWDPDKRPCSKELLEDFF